MYYLRIFVEVIFVLLGAMTWSRFFIKDINAKTIVCELSIKRVVKFCVVT